VGSRFLVLLVSRRSIFGLGQGWSAAQQELVILALVKNCTKRGYISRKVYQSCVLRTKPVKSLKKNPFKTITCNGLCTHIYIWVVAWPSGRTKKNPVLLLNWPWPGAVAGGLSSDDYVSRRVTLPLASLGATHLESVAALLILDWVSIGYLRLTDNFPPRHWVSTQ